MSQETGKFNVLISGQTATPLFFEKDGILMGRLSTCEIVLEHPAVSRVHAGINYRDGNYVLVNVSSSNILTLNGRQLRSGQEDVLADGDTIQIGPFTVAVAKDAEVLNLNARQAVETAVGSVKPSDSPKSEEPEEAGGVLDIFWEKRRREKEDWGTRLRPTEAPRPGKAMFNWRPTSDLRTSWRGGLFVWAIIILGAAGAFAYLKYPQTYAPEALTSAHASTLESSKIAARSNGNACTTCHTPNVPVENACVSCHQAEQFHASNTKAHQDAGITCTACHQEHRGQDFQMTATAVHSCSQCHSDSNLTTYNGRKVHTPHGGTYGYPAENGRWTWKGVYREVADAIPEVNSSATGDKDEQARLSRQFHTIHVSRLRAPEGVKGDARGLVSCSSCHKSFNPVDRETPRQTCAACHTTPADAKGRDMRFGVGSANCISCHVQHPYSSGRWNEFLTDDAMDRRKQAIAAQIERLSQK